MTTKSPGNLIGYARTSTREQVAGLEDQIAKLNAAGCAIVRSEQVSSMKTEDRKEFATVMQFMRPGDTLVVTKLDRLARSVAHLLEIVKELETKGAHLRILDNSGIDTSSSNGKLMLTMIGAFAQFEREIMLERQRVGIEKAKAEGRYNGRPRTASGEEASARVAEMTAQGVSIPKIAAALGISTASVSRIRKELKEGLTG